MERSLILIFGMLAAATNIIGGVWLSSLKIISDRLLKCLIALGAGFMLAAVFLEVLPASLMVAGGHGAAVMPLVLAGYLGIHFLQNHLVAHLHLGQAHDADCADEHIAHEHIAHNVYKEDLLSQAAAYNLNTVACIKQEVAAPALTRQVAFATIGGMAIHTFFDGVSIASGFVINAKVGLLIFIAIMLHKLPEGLTVAAVMIGCGLTRRSARWATILVGLVTLLGTAVILMTKHTAHYALPISAGATIFVAASDLIPAVSLSKDRVAITLSVFSGVAFYYATAILLDIFHIS